MITRPRCRVPQALLERCLLLADKYDMACLMQRLAGRLAEPCTAYSMDPAAPNFALRCGLRHATYPLLPAPGHIPAALQYVIFDCPADGADVLM